jgi:CRISPR-associated endonuclease/helicase Cas3
VADLDAYNSHPDKKLTVHVDGVVEGTRSRTDLAIADLAAIFHDVGKLNPNFQEKLKPDGKPGSYDHHSYLSATAFLCYFLQNRKQTLEEVHGQNGLGSVLTLIARHHGNLPDFPRIMKDREVNNMMAFLSTDPNLPASELVNVWKRHNTFDLKNHLKEVKRLCQTDSLKRLIGPIENPLRFFMETQWAFASLVAADKTDAGGYAPQTDAVEAFCRDYGTCLDGKLNSLPQNSDLNRLRTAMREEACSTLRKEVATGRRVFSLAAPTGAGKTFMMLALARDIIAQQGAHRLIYALPFLSITEQVEEVAEDVFGDLSQHIRRIDSKGRNERIQTLQERLENGDPEALQAMRAEQFATETFDHPFIITTFVRVFETLVSNRNAELLKLPSFQNSIFLIDEIQSLPPRLYGFFVAYLDAFCEMHNCYAVISTATMPNFQLPEETRHDVQAFFPDYEAPANHDLLSADYFQHDLFDRYTVTALDEPLSLNKLANRIGQEKQSVLVILSTIDDTKKLYGELNGDVNARVELLNTHFTPEDRRAKIATCQAILNPEEETTDDRVILISTQLIEAGVDISFPVLYRDICPVPSVVQSAGRCNRNGEAEGKGKVILFDFHREGKSRASLIYRGRDGGFLDYVRQRLPGSRFDEPELLDVQRGFFDEFVHEKTLFGVDFGGLYKKDEIEEGRLDFLARMKEAHFEEIGKFQLIKPHHGDEYRFYAPGENDRSFEQLKDAYKDLIAIPFEKHKESRVAFLKLQNLLRRMSDRTIHVRVGEHDKDSVAGAMTADECCGLRRLCPGYYDSENGLQMATVAIL